MFRRNLYTGHVSQNRELHGEYKRLFRNWTGIICIMAALIGYVYIQMCKVKIVHTEKLSEWT